MKNSQNIYDRPTGKCVTRVICLRSSLGFVLHICTGEMGHLEFISVKLIT